MISAVLLLALAIGMIIYRLSVREETPGTESFFGMNTIMTITAYGEFRDEALYSAKLTVSELENMFSVTIPDSDVSKINTADGESVGVDEKLVYITETALEYSALTDGAFDITMYPVSKLWGFDGGENRVPSDEEISEVLKNVGYKKISVDDKAMTISVPRGTGLDYGAIAKGYAEDETVRTLKNLNIESAIINFGGSISMIGSKPSGKPWVIAIKSPEGSGSAGTLALRDCSVVTSGKHERFFTDADGREYCHIMDPNTGRPVESEFDSITVICDSAMMGDALSTAFYVKGWEWALSYRSTHPGIELVGVSGLTVYLTEGIADSFTPAEGFEAVIR